MQSELELRVQNARDAVEKELRHARSSGLGRLHVLALEHPAAFEDRLGPALCLSACSLLGGPTETATSAAAVVELTRGSFAMSQRDWTAVEFGPAKASAGGGGRLSLAVGALVQHAQGLNPDAALRTLEVHAEMAREFAAGNQTIADWVTHRRWDIEQLEYVKVVCQTKAWSTFVAPLMSGVVAANASDERARLFRRFAVLLGTASYIGREAKTLRGCAGDRSLPILHAVHSAEPGLREELVDALTTPRQRRADELVRNTMTVAGSVEYTRAFARHLAERARTVLAQACAGFPDSQEQDFFDALVRHTMETASLRK